MARFLSLVILSAMFSCSAHAARKCDHLLLANQTATAVDSDEEILERFLNELSLDRDGHMTTPNDDRRFGRTYWYGSKTPDERYNFPPSGQKVAVAERSRNGGSFKPAETSLGAGFSIYELRKDETDQYFSWSLNTRDAINPVFKLWSPKRYEINVYTYDKDTRHNEISFRSFIQIDQPHSIKHLSDGRVALQFQVDPMHWGREGEIFAVRFIMGDKGIEAVEYDNREMGFRDALPPYRQGYSGNYHTLRFEYKPTVWSRLKEGLFGR